MRVSGSTMLCRGRGSRGGLTVLSMTGSMSKIASMVKEAITGLMVPTILENGSKTRLKVSAPIYGKTVENTTVSGRRMICMDMGSTSIQIRSDMMGSFLKIKNLAMESTTGQTIGNTKGGGCTENNMVWAFLQTRTNRLCDLGCGKEVDGLRISMNKN